MSTLVECVPNFSEGRDKAKVDAIVEAMKVNGVYLLDREMDADHNRCVITLVGGREAIQEAAIRGVGEHEPLATLRLLAPIQAPEIWCAGVTYEPSRDARLEEAQSGAGDVYTRVYEAERPELFFKDAQIRRTVGPEGQIRIRSDSR